jgi:nucleoid DNA-binding protein
MKKLFALFFSCLFLISNIHSINIKKNENSLGMKKSILDDFLNHKFEVNRNDYDDRTQINLIIYKNQKNQKELPKPTQQDLVKNIADYLRQNLENQQVQQAVDDAVEQLQQLAEQQNVTPQQVQQAVQQVLDQLPQQVAQQVQEAVQQLPQQVTHQQVQQIIDQVQDRKRLV